MRSFHHEFPDGFAVSVDTFHGLALALSPTGRVVGEKKVRPDDTEGTLRLWAQNVIIRDKT